MWCEEKTAEYLQIRGWRILERRVNFREGELDLVCEFEGELRFVEVKGSRSRQFGSVVERLTREKLRRMRKAVWRWREARRDYREGSFWFAGVEVLEDQVTVELLLLDS